MKDIPMIRDMVHRCKCCGNYFFEVNADGICAICERGETELNLPKPKSESEMPWDNL